MRVCPIKDCGKRMSQRCTGSWICESCKYIESYSNTIETQMKEKQAQRFGRIVESFGDFGELRRQHKKPNLEIFYIPVKMPSKTKIGVGFGEAYSVVLRSVNNCSNEQIIGFIQIVGKNLEAGNLKQEKAEFILDKLYQEINRRVNNGTSTNS